MAFDAFIKFTGVDGESKRKGFEKHIEIYSFSLGASNPTTIGAGGGGGAGKVSISSFNLMKKSYITSPVLFQKCCMGEHFDKVTVSLNKAGGKELKGLTRRRNSEAVMFAGLSDENFDGVADDPMPQAIDDGDIEK